MEIIKAENLLQSLSKLKEKEFVLIDFPDKELKKIELMEFKIHSLESLFTSYTNLTSEKANSFNLEKFLTLYAKTVQEKQQIFLDASVRCMGTEVYEYSNNSNNKICFFLYPDIKKLVFKKTFNKVE